MTTVAAAEAATVEIVVPVHNEASGLGASVHRLHRYLVDRFPLSWSVTIADNASTDGTWDLARDLADRLPGVRALHLDEKGRGRALRAAWLGSRSPVVAYMDVDLSTDLDALLPLVAPLVSGHSDVAIGTRLAPDARVVRGPGRELISRSYNLLLKATLHSGFSDAQCGFKAVRTDVARALLPLVEDQQWFFDTELLVLAERNGFRIHEVPVDWVDDPDSRVDVVRTATADLRGIWRLLRRIAIGRATADLPSAPAASNDGDLAGQLARFASIGVVSTVLFAALVAVLAGPLGWVVADLAALGLCSVANTAANRRLTFSLQGRSGRARQYAGGLVLAALPVALTLLALAALEVAGVGALWARVTVLAAASAAASVGRFVALRRWVFRPAGGRLPAPEQKETPMTVTAEMSVAPEAPVELGRPRRTSRSGWITAAIGALTAGLYTWDLSSVGMGNSYYAAAVKAMSVSWKAFLFGSIDPGNFITVDKPPAALWAQALSARIFGFISWSMLLPQALAGVGSVLVLHHLVKRWAGDTAAHLAALAFALTPVALLMFRYNNPDAFLTFLGLAGAWALWSALETGRTRMLLVAGAISGLAFQAKMLQAFLVLPAFGLVYLVAGPPKLGRRLVQLSWAGVAMVVSAGWWVAVVALWPASARPFIGGTSDNSILSLIFGYNGLARLFGRTGPGGGGAGGPGGGGPGGGAGFGGAPGWLRMFDAANGGQVAWLLPLAFAGLLAGLWLTRRGPRTDLARAGWLLWGGWAAVCYLVFSKAEGIYHPYYTVQLAPAVGALAGAGGVALWKLGRSATWLRMALPAALVVTGGWAISLLVRTPGFSPWLRPAIVGGVALASAGIWLAWQFRNRAVLVAAGAVAAASMLAGPAAYAVATLGNASTGAIIAAGPSGGPGAGRGGGPGGDATVDPGLLDYLEANQGDATYLVAAFGSGSSAPFILASGRPVMTIGGFNGGDPAPTLAQFQALVADGKVRFIVLGGTGGGQGGPAGNGSSQIRSWVTQHATPVPANAYGGTGTSTLYDLAGAGG